MADIRDHRTDGWLIVARRRQPFPADEQHRHASRLRGLVKAHAHFAANLLRVRTRPSRLFHASQGGTQGPLPPPVDHVQWPVS